MITFKVTKAGEGIGNDDVSSVDFMLKSNEVTGFKILTSSADDGNARGRNLIVGMEVTGAILSGFGDEVADDTVHMAEWANAPAESTAAYRNVAVELGTAGIVERSYMLNQAYVKSYKEFFTNNKDGHFKLILAQRRTGKAAADMVSISGGFKIGG